MFFCSFTEGPHFSTIKLETHLSRHWVNVYLVCECSRNLRWQRTKASGSSYLPAIPFPKLFLPFPFISCLEPPIFKPNLRTNSGHEKTTQFILLVSYFFSSFHYKHNINGIATFSPPGGDPSSLSAGALASDSQLIMRYVQGMVT